MRIYPIISITQLEPAISEINFYSRNSEIDSLFVTNVYKKSDASFYKIERLLDKRITRDKTYYLVK